MARRAAAERKAISIHALHEESDTLKRVNPKILSISIHALHEESDFDFRSGSMRSVISIHALHEESDSAGRGIPAARRDFNPRSP